MIINEIDGHFEVADYDSDVATSFPTLDEAESYVRMSGGSEFEAPTVEAAQETISSPVIQGKRVTVPMTYYSQGANAGGPDESQDTYTNRGYSSLGPNLTEGVVAVGSRAQLGTIYLDPSTQEVFIASDRHGNKDKNVIDAYRAPENYVMRRDAKDLVIVDKIPINKVPKTVEGIKRMRSDYAQRYFGEQRSYETAQIEEPPLPSDIHEEPAQVSLESMYLNGEGLPSDEDLRYIVGDTGDPEEEKWRVANMKFVEASGEDASTVNASYDTYYQPKLASELGLPKDASNKQISRKLKEGFGVKKEVNEFYEDLGATAMADAAKAFISGKKTSWHISYGKHLPTAEQREKMSFLGQPAINHSMAMATYRRSYESLGKFAKKYPDIAGWNGDMAKLPELAKQIGAMEKADRRYAVVAMQMLNERVGESRPILSDIANAVTEATGGMIDQRNLMYSRAKLNAIAKSDEAIYRNEKGELRKSSDFARTTFLPEIPEGWEKLPKGEGQKIARDYLNYTQVLAELETYYGQGAMDRSFWREGIVGAAQSLPEMGRALALSPMGLGTASMIEGMTAQKYKELIATYPDIPEGQAQAIAIASGTVQGVIEHWQLKNIVGSDTPLGKSIGRFTNIGSGFWRNVFKKFGANWAEQTAEEVSQSIADIVIDELAQGFGADIQPQARQRFKELWNQSPALLVTTGFFAGMGTGPGLLRKSNRARMVVENGSPKQLEAMGYDKEQVNRIVNSEDRLETASNIVPATIAKLIPNGRNPGSVAKTVGPRITATDDGKFEVRNPTGEVTVVDTREEASDLYMASVEAIPQESIDQIETYAGGDTSDFEASGNVSIVNRVAASSVDMETGEMGAVYGSKATIADDVENYSRRIFDGSSIQEVARSAYSNSIFDSIENGVVSEQSVYDAVEAFGIPLEGMSQEMRDDVVADAVADIGEAYINGQIDLNDYPADFANYLKQQAEIIREATGRGLSAKQSGDESLLSVSQEQDGEESWQSFEEQQQQHKVINEIMGEPISGGRISEEAVRKKIAEKLDRPEQRTEVYGRARNALSQLKERFFEKEKTPSRIANADTRAAINALGAIEKMLPAEVQTKVTAPMYARLATLKSGGARTKAILEMIDRIDEHFEAHLKKEFTKKIGNLLSRYRQRKTTSGVLKSAIGDAQRVVNLAKTYFKPNAKASERTSLENEAAQDIVTADAKLMDDELPQEVRDNAVVDMAIIKAFSSPWNKSAKELESALESLNSLIKHGRTRWRTKEEARLAEIQHEKDFILGLKGEPDPHEVHLAESRVKKVGPVDWRDEHYDVRQILNSIFSASKSSFARDVTSELRRAEVDAQARRRRRMDRFLKSFNGYLRTQGKREGDLWRARATLDKELVKSLESNVKIPYGSGKYTMNRQQAITLKMLWLRPEGREGLIRTGFTQESIAAAITATDNDFDRWMESFVRREFKNESGEINALHKDLTGLDLPMDDNYVPLSWDSGREDKVPNPYETDVGTGSLYPGFIKPTVKHGLKIRLNEIMPSYWRHGGQVDHWLATAKTVRKWQNVFGDVKVANRIKVDSSPKTLRKLRDFLNILQQGGAKDAEANHVANSFLRKLMSNAAIAYLSMNIKSVLNAADAAMRHFEIVPFHRTPDLMIKTLFSGEFRKRYSEIWNRDIIQNRLKEGAFNPVVREAMNRHNENPSIFTRMAERGFLPMSYFENFLTVISSMQVAQKSFEDAKKMGMTEAAAESFAADAVDDFVYFYSQPGGLLNRSTFETTGGTLGKLYTFMKSDLRQQTSRFFEAWENIFRGEDIGMSVQKLLALGARAILFQMITDGFMHLTGNDDEDDDEARSARYALAFFLGPVNGLLIAGDLMQMGSAMLTGDRYFRTSLNPVVDIMARFNTTIKKIARDPEEMFEDPRAMSQNLKVISQTFAIFFGGPAKAAAAMSNVLDTAIDMTNEED